MNTECFCVDRIPDLTLAKYSAQEGGMQKDVLKQQMLFHRQMNRRGLLFDTSYRFIVLYQADGKPGSRLRFYLSTDAKENEISVEKILRSSQLSVYYHFEQCEAPDLSKLPCSAMIVKHSNILLDSEGRPSYYVVDEWKMNEAARLISLFRMMAALEQDCAYEVELRPCKLAEEERNRLEELANDARNRASSDYGKDRDENAQKTARRYQKLLESYDKYPYFQCRIRAYAGDTETAQMLVDVAASEAVDEGGYEIIDGSEDGKDHNTNMREGLENLRIRFSLKEITPFAVFPVLYPGESIEIPKESSPLLRAQEESGKTLLLGEDQFGYKVELPLKIFPKHAFITGVPGGGKTYTMLRLISELARVDNVPFLVLEPAKKEYRALIRNPQKELSDVTIFSPGGQGPFMLRINPFEFPLGMSVTQHETYLNQVFAGAFDMEAPMPMLMEEAIHNVYEKNMWLPDMINDGTLPYPTMSMLYDELTEVMKDKYEGETRKNMKSFLEVRIGSLVRGSMGSVFNVGGSTLKPEEWLQRKCVIELEALGTDGANFLTLLILSLIRSCIRVNPRSDKDIRHVIFLEEAHNIIGSGTESRGERTADVKTASTKFIVDMLAEVRALKEGIIIADQLPTALAVQVTKNTSMKIAHKMVAMDDRASLGETMSMDAVQLEQMAQYRSGRALCIYDGITRPFEIQVAKYVDDDRDSISPDDEELEKLLIGHPEYRKDMLRDYDIMEEKKSNEYIERFMSMKRLLKVIDNNKNYDKSSDGLSDKELQEARDCLWKLYGSYVGWVDYLISNPVAIETKTELTEKIENRKKELDTILEVFRKEVPIIEVTDQEQKNSEKRKRKARGIESNMIKYLEQGLEKHNDQLQKKLHVVNAG